MLSQIHRRALDGIHWNPDAVRMQVNIILTHYCLSREIGLPGNWNRGQPPTKQNLGLEEAMMLADAAYEDLQPRKRLLEEENGKPKSDTRRYDYERER